MPKWKVSCFDFRDKVEKYFDFVIEAPSYLEAILKALHKLSPNLSWRDEKLGICDIEAC